MQHTTELADRLVGIANELLQVAKALGNTMAREPEFPQKAIDKYVAGICLNCGRARKETRGSFRRGNCPTCSNRINRELQRAAAPSQLERQFISDGLLAPIDFKAEVDPIKNAIAKAATADHHFADPELKPPGRKRASRKK